MALQVGKETSTWAGIKTMGEAYLGGLNGVKEGPWDAVFVDGLD
jgi:hypothetical protein